MEKAPIEQKITIPGYEDVEAGIVKWPLSVIRIRHKDEKRLIDLTDHILQCWRGYTDEEAFIYAETDEGPHNTITPIARQKDGVFELDLTLRNNITTEEYPLGYYHPHPQWHHIKKENIGLIEVMGLAILPARLKKEMELLKRFILEGKDIRSDEALAKHADWVEEFTPQIRGIYRRKPGRHPEKGDRKCVCKSAGRRRGLQMHAGGTKEIYEIYQLSVTDRYKKAAAQSAVFFG